MKICLYDRAPEMWENVEGKGYLVFPGDFARESFWRTHRGIDWNPERVLSLVDLWYLLADRLDMAAPLLPGEFSTAARKHLDDLAEITRLVSLRGGWDTLEAHLAQIDIYADSDFSAGSDIEEEMLLLRQRMNGAGQLTQTAWRSEIARRSGEIDLGSEVEFLPLPEPTRQIGSLLAGLDQTNSVVLHHLLEEELLASWLDDLGLDEQAVEKHFSDHHVLFTEGVDQREHLWFFAQDEYALALELADREIKAGRDPREMAFVVADVDRASVALSQYKTDIPLLLRSAVQHEDTALSYLLIRLAESRSLQDTMFEGWIEEERLREIASSSRKVELLLQTGDDLLLSLDPERYDVARSEVWLQEARRMFRSMKSKGIYPSDAGEFFRSISSGRLIRGDIDGVRVLSYGESPAFSFSWGVYFLPAGVYPQERSSLPLFSSQALLHSPQMHGGERRSQFVSALLSGEERIFVRGEEKEKSPYYLETERAWAGAEEFVPLEDLGRYGARDAVAAGDYLHENASRLPRQPLLRAGQPRRKYSVTELEQYLRCPYGWFVQHALGARSFSSGANLGLELHQKLQDAFSFSDLADRLAALASPIEGVLPAEEDLWRGRLEHIVRTTSPPEWFFPESRHEIDLHLSEETDIGLLEIGGRIDRIDFSPDGKQILLIDYKTNAPTKSPLQPLLYSHMAARHFDAEVLGFLYLSIRTGKFSGYLRKPLRGIEGKGISFAWGRYEKTATQNLLRAVSGIEEGAWSARGKSCPEWCPHRMLSETGVL